MKISGNINLGNVQKLIDNSRISAKSISELTDIPQATIQSYRNTSSTPLDSMPIRTALKLSRLMDNQDLMEELVGIPTGISVNHLKSGGVSWKAQVYDDHQRKFLGSFTSKSKAIAARNEYIFTHPDTVNIGNKKTVKRAEPIEITHEIKERLKHTKGVSVYKQARTGEVIGFRADIMRDGKRKYLGKFLTIAEAEKAYQEAENDD